MQIQLDIEGMCQYSQDVLPQYQNSACGPTTVYVILKYLFPNEQITDINKLYELLGGTKIGLFKWRLIKRLQKELGSSWHVSECTLHEALKQLMAGRPVAMKFDQYFTFQFNETPTFKYHWVPLIGYEINNDELYLIIHDNGGRTRDSQIRKVRYADNYKVLSFVKIEPSTFWKCDR